MSGLTRWSASYEDRGAMDMDDEGDYVALEEVQERVRGLIAGLLFRVGQLSDLEDAAYDRKDTAMGNMLQRLGETTRTVRALARASGIVISL